MYRLYREDNENVGDSGGMSILLWEESGEVKFENDARPRVGTAILVGSLYARTMQYQDWWQTSYITEILEESENRVKFKTQNSVYIWEKV